MCGSDRSTSHRPGDERLPRLPLQEVLRDPTELNLWFAKGRDGNISLLELVVIISLVRARDPRILFEFGTFDGRTTVNLAANTHQEARVYSLDLGSQASSTTLFPLLPDEEGYTVEYGSLIARFPGRQKVLRVCGDSAKFDFSTFLEKVDFCFVDGSHALDYVRCDSENAYRITRAGGTIVWHDYLHWEGVTVGLEAMYANEGRFRGMRHVESTTLVLLEKSAAEPATRTG